jgi:hypothetical protein
MGAGDGYIGATTKIVDHGPDSSRYTIAILGDGYQASELPKYHADVQAFVDTIFNTAPYTDVWCGINIYRIDVASTESGADDPADCPDQSDGPPTGATAKTFFDATFCSTGPGGVSIHRLLSVDSTRAMAASKAQVPLRQLTIVIVNTPIYGGSGGPVAVCSTNSLASRIAIHEIGHTLYGFTDEYEGDGTGTSPGEPPFPNATRDTNAATNKWGDLILPATPMPSSCYSDCPGCVPPETPPPPGAVGTYEGANYAHCGVYRPFPTCYMRDLSTPTFCPVCARVIQQFFKTYLPTETRTLLTPSIAFTDVPQGVGGTGVTTYRAIVFELDSCRTLTFRMTNPTGGFGTPFGLSDTVPPAEIAPLGYARLWLSYTSTSIGSSAIGVVTASCDETGETWPITITANTVARPKSAIVFVLDHSGSMSEDAGDGVPKVQKLREAATTFIDVMQQGDGLGIVRFDDTAQRLMDVTDVGPAIGGAGRATATGHIAGPEIDPAGNTSIGDGVVKGKQALDDAQAAATPPYDVTAMVVLTDGEENTRPMLSEVSGSISANTFAVGLGLPSNISVAALSQLTLGHNGYLLITGAITTDQSTRLTKYFLQILAGITNANVIVDPHGELVDRAEHKIPFLVTEADIGLDVIVLCQFPQLLNFQLETPNGRRVTPVDAGALGTFEFVPKANVVYYRASLPLDPAVPLGSHQGLWNAVLSLRRSDSRKGLPYDVTVHCYSNLVFHANAQQTSFEPGAVVNLFATLQEYDVPVDHRATVWSEIQRPDGSSGILGFNENDPGRFISSFVANQAGLYTIRCRARGETFFGSRFDREQTVTAAVFPGGDSQQPAPSNSSICQLLDCLLSKGALSKHLLERLAKEGVDIRRLRDCVCTPARDTPIR